MKARFIFLILATLSFASWNANAAPDRKPANCELRLVNNAAAGAGEIFMSIFTHSKEECLGKSDNSVEAKYKDGRGDIVAKRGGGMGPQP